MIASDPDSTMTASTAGGFEMADHPAHPITLALHVTQDLIPLTSSKSVAYSQHLGVPSVGGSASYAQAVQDVGYSPKPPVQPTPMSQLATQHLHDESEFGLLCAPLSNQKWHERWDRMCVASSPGRRRSSGPEDNQTNGFAPSASGGAENDAFSNRREAEMWRLAGAFNREEVNMTRAGVSGD